MPCPDVVAAGSGCVPIYNLMEDAATAEICRSQEWQWVRHGAALSDGRQVTQEMVRKVIIEQKNKLQGARTAEAAEIFEHMMTSPDFAEFLTLVAYDCIDWEYTGRLRGLSPDSAE